MGYNLKTSKVELIEANFHVFSIFLRVLVAAAAGTATSAIAPQTGKSMSAIRSHPKVFAAGGEVDEVCAHAGITAIADAIEF